jgi:hypothetical protein
MTKKGYWVVCYKSVSNPAAPSEYTKLADDRAGSFGRSRDRGRQAC